MITLGASLLLAGYELLRPVASSLFKAYYGAEMLPYAMAAIPVTAALLVWWHSFLIRTIGTRYTLRVTLGSFTVFLGVCLFLLHRDFHPAAAALYIIREAAVLLVLEQYWSLMNCHMDVAMARRWNGAIGGIGSLGAITGSTLAAQLAQGMGSINLIALSALFFIGAVITVDFAYPRVNPTRLASSHQHASFGKVKDTFRAHPVLGLMLAMVIGEQIVMAAATLNFETVLQAAIPSIDAQTAWAGRVYAAVSAVSMVGQFILSPLLLRYLPLGWILIANAVLMAFAALLAGTDGLYIAAGVYLVAKVIDYSIYRASKEILYIPLPFEARFVAKEWIDVFGFRTAKGGAALIFGFLKSSGVALAGIYAPVALAASLGWAVAATVIHRRGYASIK
jgi:AAA family ATP:ADP antiporter